MRNVALRRALLLALLAALLATPPAMARIKLAALPQRERVEIQLDNGRFTLVEEERIVPLLKSTPQAGNNMIDFSWSNTAIDKNSIQFRPLAIMQGGSFRPIAKVDEDTDEVTVINVAYPPGENALVWEVFAQAACSAKVRVSYLISNLSRSFSYRAKADNDETALTLRNFIQLSNYSGEEFGYAGVWAGFGEKFLKEVGQQEDIKMLLHRFEDVPIEKTYTFDWYANGPLNPDKPFASKILMHYKLVNDEKHAMGLFPLQPGKVRIFIDDSRGGEAFLGEDWAQLTPLDGDMKLYLGEARDVVCERTIEHKQRQLLQGNLYNLDMTIKYEIQNFKDKPVTLDIVEQLNRVAQEHFGRTVGDVEWEMFPRSAKELNVTYEQGGSTPILHIQLPAKPKENVEDVEKVTVRFQLTLKNLWQ